MKKIFFLLLLAVTGLFNLAIAQKSSDQFILNGTLTNKSDGLMYLYYSNKDNKRVIDSAAITNSKFSFKGKIIEPGMAYLSLKEEKRNDNNSVDFFLEPGLITTTLSLNKFREAKFTGSKTQDEYAPLQSKKRKIQERWKVVMDTLSAVNKRSNIEFQELKDWALLPYFDEMKELDYAFFESHPQSYVSANILRYHVRDLSLDSLQMFYNKLGKKLQQTNDGKELAKEIYKLRNGSPGAVAAAFTANDINGNKLSMSDFKGRYVLIDFWASWCVPCRKSSPHLLELYKEYHDKGLDIIGVSDDDNNHDAWKKAVAMDGVDIWHHVLRGLDWDKINKGQENPNDISEKYGIHELPTKILIDKNGVIIGRYDKGTEEEKDAMDKKIAEVLK